MALNPKLNNQIVLVGFDPVVAIQKFKSWYAAMKKGPAAAFTYFSVAIGFKFSQIAAENKLRSAFVEYISTTRLFQCKEDVDDTFICKNLSPVDECVDSEFSLRDLKFYNRKLSNDFKFTNPSSSDLENEIILVGFANNVALRYFIDWFQNRENLCLKSKSSFSPSFTVITGYRALKFDDSSKDNFRAVVSKYIKSLGTVISCVSLQDRNGLFCLQVQLIEYKFAKLIYKFAKLDISGMDNDIGLQVFSNWYEANTAKCRDTGHGIVDYPFFEVITGPIRLEEGKRNELRQNFAVFVFNKKGQIKCRIFGTNGYACEVLFNCS